MNILDFFLKKYGLNALWSPYFHNFKVLIPYLKIQIFGPLLSFIWDFYGPLPNLLELDYYCSNDMSLVRTPHI